MARRSKIDLLYEVVLNLKEEFSGFKTEVKSEIQEIKNDLYILKKDVNALKSEAIKHGWNV